MDNIVKSFSFSAENVTLTLSIMKEVNKSHLLMYIKGEIKSNNDELIIKRKITEQDDEILTIYYKDSQFFYLGNLKKDYYKIASECCWSRYAYKKDRNIKTIVYSYENINEMVDKYKKSMNDINKVSEYFYSQMESYKKMKILYETSIDDVYSEEK